jgi:hypothetical protein|uniref:Uncharacterized protein n=1 Tax=viral metagenome TaxID=1070528 RepID=A0A6C0CM31_9ZZZZ
MGYEIEMSLDLRKHKSVTKIIDDTQDLAEYYECERYYQFSECEGEIRRLKRKAQVMVFCFDDNKFENMSNFLKDVIAKYKKRLYIESIYDINRHSLIYASPYYMSIMEREQKDDYKERRTNRSFSETDYFILREILKKNY